MPKVSINESCPAHATSRNTAVTDNITLSEETIRILSALQELQTSEDSLSCLCRQGIISDVGTAMYEMSKGLCRFCQRLIQ